MELLQKIKDSFNIKVLPFVILYCGIDLLELIKDYLREVNNLSLTLSFSFVYLLTAFLASVYIIEVIRKEYEKGELPDFASSLNKKNLLILLKFIALNIILVAAILPGLILSFLCFKQNLFAGVIGLISVLILTILLGYLFSPSLFIITIKNSLKKAFKAYKISLTFNWFVAQLIIFCIYFLIVFAYAIIVIIYVTLFISIYKEAFYEAPDILRDPVFLFITILFSSLFAIVSIGAIRYLTNVYKSLEHKIE